jgi:hypothetical protein
MRIIIQPETITIPFVLQNAEYQDATNNNFASCLCGCETWPFTLREEHKLEVFETED